MLPGSCPSSPCPTVQRRRGARPRPCAGSRGSLLSHGARPPFRGAPLDIDGDGLELPSDDIFLKLTPLKREGSGGSVLELAKPPSTTSSDAERILAVPAQVLHTALLFTAPKYTMLQCPISVNCVRPCCGGA